MLHAAITVYHVVGVPQPAGSGINISMTGAGSPVTGTALTGRKVSIALVSIVWSGAASKAKPCQVVLSIIA